MTRSAYVVAIALLLVLTIVPFIPGEEAAVSTPDAYGYKYVDNSEPEPILEYEYINIRNDPNVIGWDTNNREAVVQANMGFFFDYYGTNYDKVYISTYGAMSFVDGASSSYSNNWNKRIPSTDVPRGLIAPYWTWSNCQTPNKDRLFSLQTTIDGENAFVVEWNPTTGGKFQAAFYEGGMIRFNYDSVPNGVMGYYATIGIEKPDGTTGHSIHGYQYEATDIYTLPCSIAFISEEVKVRDVDLINGGGKWGDTIYAGSEPYHFRVEATHSDGAQNMLNVILNLGSLWEQENIRFQYSHKNHTFTQLSGISYASLSEDECTYTQNSNTLAVDFFVDFSLDYPSEDMRNVTAKANGRSAVPDSLDTGHLYWVENDVEWNPDDLYVFRQSDTRVLQRNDYIAGEETIRFTGIRVVYQDSDVQPPPKLFDLLVTDNYNTSKAAYITQGSMMDLTWTSVRESTAMSWDFEVRGFPSDSISQEKTFDFALIVDIDGPDEVPSISVHPDSKDDPPAENDNDDMVFVKWEPAVDGGAGIGSYMIRAEAEGYFLEKEVAKYLNYTKIGDQYGKELPEGVVNISIIPVDDVGNPGPSTWTLFKVDFTGPRYEMMDPLPGEWVLSTRPDIDIRIQDDLTGVEGSTLDYRISKDGGYTFEDWTSFYYFGTENDVVRTIKPTLWEGKENIIQIMGTDVAGSEVTTSEELPIWVDARAPSITMSEPEVDQNGTTVEWLRDINEPLRIKIHDWKGAGIDPTRISYRYSKDGGRSFSADIPLEGEGYNNTQNFFEYSFTIRKDWNQGSDNILVLDAFDLVGRNTTSTFRVRFDVIPEMTLLSPLPTMQLYDNETILFKVQVIDRDGEEDLTISWLSNIDGILGTGREIESYLSPGDHIIQVTVEDGVHLVRKIFTVVVKASILDDPRYRDSDGDGMNDSFEMNNGLNPLLDDSAGDLDGDGYSNLEEFYAGTDPADKGVYPGSVIKEEPFPVIPLILTIIALILFIGAGAILVREANKGRNVPAQPPGMPAPPMQYGSYLPGNYPQQQPQALPPAAFPPPR